jgi:ABC-2 type transport system ATP-binding protein
VCDTPEALKHSLGEGDVLEINLEDDHCDGRDAVAALGEMGIRLKASQADGTLLMRGLDIVGLMPEILRTLTGAGYQCSDVRLRQNTLEDVFIQLTGRRLRE